MSSIKSIDDYIYNEYKLNELINTNNPLDLRKNHSSVNLKNNNYTVNTDSDILVDYENNIFLNIKRNGEFLALTDTKSNKKIIINLFDLFKDKSTNAVTYISFNKKKPINFFKKLFS